jgi:hypothetical protein
MVIRLFLIVFLLNAHFNVHSQSLEFTGITRLPAPLNSNAEESMPLLSPDGKKLFFSRSLYSENTGGQYAGQDIWISDFSQSGWRKATNNSENLNNKHNNVIVGLNKDGKTVYFVDASPFQKMNGIYSSRALNNYWTKPQLIYIPGINNQDFIGFYVSPDFDVIFLSMKTPESRGGEDLYYSVKDATGSWSKPVSLGATINTAGFEISPYLSADKKRLYFSSNGHGGEGDADIFYSERLYDSWETWTVPVNLGNKINSKKFDAYFSIYGDSVAYFASNRDSRYADLYKAQVKYTRTVLAKGQRYLSAEEWSTTVGRGVNRSITFPKKSVTLSAAQQELIFYIVNKLMLERDVRFHLVVKQEEDPKLTPARLRAITDELKRSGIDPARINIEQVDAISKSDRGVVELQLFR